MTEPVFQEDDSKWEVQKRETELLIVSHDILGKEYELNGVSFTVLGMQPVYYANEDDKQDLQPDVISMSFPLGAPPGDSASADLKTRFEELLKQAVSKGILVVMAAGNYSLDVNEKEIFPTRFSKIDGVISVGARDYGVLAKYSNYGTDFVGISAP